MGKEFTFDIISKISDLEVADSGWGKALIKVSWNGDVPTIDIRNMNINAYNKDGFVGRIGKGISLSDAAAEVLVEALILEGYLDDDQILEAIRKRSDVYKYKGKKPVLKFKLKGL